MLRVWSLDKFGYDFFKNVKKVEQGSTIIFKSNKYKKVKYWDLNYRPNKRINRSNVVQLTRNQVIEAVKRNTVSDVPISILLSGGVDLKYYIISGNENFTKKVTTFSIIDGDKRYNENNLIDVLVKNHKVKNFKIKLKKIKVDRLIRDLEKYVNYNSKPLYTITSYVSSKLHKLIKKKI